MNLSIKFATNQKQNFAQPTVEISNKVKSCAQDNNAKFVAQNYIANYAKANINFKGQNNINDCANEKLMQISKEKAERDLTYLEKKLIEANKEDDDWYISKIIDKIKSKNPKVQQLLINFVNKLVEVSDISFSDNQIISDYVSTINRNNLESQQQIINFAIELIETNEIKKDEISALPYTLMHINSDNPEMQQQIIDFAKEMIKSCDIKKGELQLLNCVLSNISSDNMDTQKQLFEFGKELIKSDKIDMQSITSILECLQSDSISPNALKNLIKLASGLIEPCKTNLNQICTIINFYKSKDNFLDDASISDITTNADEIYTKIITDNILEKAKEGLNNINPEDTELYYNKINEFYHGTRVDPTFTDKKLNINGNKITLFADNNMATKSYVENMYIQGKQIPNNIQIVSDSTLKTIQDAFEQMETTGQPLPKKIYITDLISKEASGFSVSDAIFISSELFENKLNRAKDAIYHESAHVADRCHAKDCRFLSEEKGININKKLEEIKFNEDVIPNSKIKKLISNYSTTNPQEFVAEVSMLITRGIIKQKPDGNYTIMTEPDGFYHNAQSDVRFYDSDTEDLNKIIKLYMLLTEGKICKPQQIV